MHSAKRLIFSTQAKEDLAYWRDHDRKKAERILALLEAVLSDPFKGVGKPEPLKYLRPTCWSRRIDREHRLVYRVEEDGITILACRYHYK